MKKREEVILFAEIEGHNFGLLVINLHLIFISEDYKVSKLVLQSLVLWRENEVRNLVEVQRTNDRRGRDQLGLQVKSFQ